MPKKLSLEAKLDDLRDENKQQFKMLSSKIEESNRLIAESHRLIDGLAINTKNQFDEVNSRLDSIDNRLNKVENGIMSVDQRLATVEGFLPSHDRRIERLEEDVYQLKKTIQRK